MNNNNLKKRRPFCSEESPSEPALQDIPPFQPQPPHLQHPHPSAHTLPSFSIESFTPQQRHTLEQAAVILDVPLQRLLDIKHEAPHTHLFKKPRLNSSASDTAMLPQQPLPPPPTPSHDFDEKPPSSITQSSDGLADSRRPYQVFSESPFPVTLSLENSGLAQCFGAFDVCTPCTTFESRNGYSPLPTSGGFEYGSNRPYQVEKPPVGEQTYPSTAPVPQDQPGMFPPNVMDDQSFAYPQEYPAMQPARGALTVQSAATREEMVYPAENSPMSAYFSSAPAPGVEHAIAGGPSAVSHVTADSAGGMATPVASQISAAVPVAAGTQMLPPGPMAAPAPPTVAAAPTTITRYGYLYGGEVFAEDPYAGAYDVMWTSGGRPPSAKRGPFKNNADREKTAQTRRIGSCIRCRMQRIRCHTDPTDEKRPCLTCQKVANTKVWRLPCLRYKITDVRLFKPGPVKGFEWTRRWTEGVVDDIGNWASTEIKTIQVNEGYADNFVELKVRKFIPQDGDRLERSWVDTNGNKRSVTIPPYAISDVKAAQVGYEDYIHKLIIKVCKCLVGPREKLLSRTYELAVSLAGGRDPKIGEKERELLQKTLLLWTAIRVTTKSAIIVGQERLGMTEDIMEDSDLHGKIPLPPVMGAQIDTIVIHSIQSKLRKALLERLQDMTQNNKQKTWLTLYLVTFILLHNISLVTRHDAGYARKHGMKRRFAREDMVAEYHMGANTLLAYFHYCNKGIYPFSSDCKDSDLTTLAALDEDALDFVRQTRMLISQHKHQWDELQRTENCEDDYYFVSQLYEENWTPRKTPIGVH